MAQVLINYLNLSIEVDNPICNINDYECLDGLGALDEKLNQVSGKIKKNNIKNIGIILDADNVGVDKRVELINDKLKTICSDVKLDKINDFKYSEQLDAKVGCYIMNVSENGELETVLKAIKSKDSTYADCLEAWRKCLEEKGKPFKDKSYDKLWDNFYQRYDNCKENESNADKNCKGKESIQKDIWDFKNPILDDLKSFLTLLSNQ